MSGQAAEARAHDAQAWRTEVECDLQFFDDPLKQVQQWLAQAKEEQHGALEDWWMHTQEVRRLTALLRTLQNGA